MELSDPTTFSAAYERHHRSVYAAAYRICGNPALAQDVVQDVFLRLWRRPAAFDPSRGELGSYLRLVARSRALDLWRESQAFGRARDRLEVVVAHEATPASADGPALRVERADGRQRALGAVGALPAVQRDALVMAYWGEMTAAEIARRTGVPLGTAKSRLRLGLAKLRDGLAPVAGAA